mmetsp:Transcript_9770/g.19169  ORF Transcript_9770/g.19169 Transcript_9770/m.19169 type:complete len:189 (+) Transcript_9770:6083-6649(+)
MSSSPFAKAIVDGNYALAKTFLTCGTDVNFRTTQGGDSALYLAAMHNQIAIVQLLLSRGANPNSLNSGDNTPLHIAARSGHLEVMKLLVEAKADGAQRNSKRQTPLHLATIESNAPAVDFLLKLFPESAKLADVNMKIPFQCCRTSELKNCFIYAENWRHRRGAIWVKRTVDEPRLSGLLFRVMIEFL